MTPVPAVAVKNIKSAAVQFKTQNGCMLDTAIFHRRNKNELQIP